MVGNQIAGYAIEGVLGEGGMGVVYRGRDTTLDRPVAVKVIHANKLGEEGRERFFREARACSRIAHPHIITVYAAGEDQGRPYLAMELIDGKTLREVINGGTVPWEKAVRWMIDLLDALSRLHDEGIIHRDLKPENIMITKDNVIKLMDFGLAHLQSSTTFTQEGTTLGTVPYMSPEQVLGKKADARSDIFSLASVFHEMLTGMYPFRGEHPMAVMYSIQNETPKPIELASQEFPAGLQDVLDRAFQKEIDKRWQSAQEFREALIHLLPAGAAVPAQQRRGGPLKIAAIAAGVVVVAVLAMWFVPRGPVNDRAEAVNLNELGQNEDSLGNTNKAIEYFRKSILADRSYAIPWNNLGSIALASGDLEEADSLFREALRCDSDYLEAMYNLATMAWDRGDLDDAKAWYYRALEIDNSYAPVLNNLGSILLREGQPEQARALFLRALDPLPETAIQAQLYKNLGKVALAMGDPPFAREYFAKSKQLQPNDSEIDQLIFEAGQR